MGATKEKSKCETLGPWLKANLGKGCLAPLTGTDSRALAAAVQIIELYAYHPEREVIEAFGRVVLAMQPKVRELAYHAIAHVMDWTDRPKIWLEAGLPRFSPQRCQHEPSAMANFLSSSDWQGRPMGVEA